MARNGKERSSSLEDLQAFACPNEGCDRFNVFGGGNLSVCEHMGRGKRIRRLYCNRCGHRFSERQGSLMAHSRLSEDTVVRIVKCLGHGCSIEATADICEVDPRTVELLLDKAGRRANDFHRLQLEKLTTSPPVVELDELHGAVSGSKKGDVWEQLAGLVAGWLPAESGFTLRWRQ